MLDLIIVVVNFFGLILDYYLIDLNVYFIGNYIQKVIVKLLRGIILRNYFKYYY